MVNKNISKKKFIEERMKYHEKLELTAKKDFIDGLKRSRNKPNICPKCSKPTYSKRVCKSCLKDKPRGRGSVTRNFRNKERRENDTKYIESKRLGRKKNRENMSEDRKEKLRIFRKNYIKKLDKFANKKCKVKLTPIEKKEKQKEFIRQLKKEGLFK